MENQINIRQAKQSDIDQLCDLLAILFTQEADFTADRNKQRAGLQEILSDSNTGQIFLAESADQIVGMVSLLFMVSTALGGRVALLEDMIIHPDFRDQKIGSDLLNTAINSARSHQCLRISLLTDADNLKAHGFYKKQGFQKSDMSLFRKLIETDQT